MIAAVGIERALERPKVPSPLLGLTLGALAVLPYLVWDLPWRSYADATDAIDGVVESTALSLAVGGTLGLATRRLTGEVARTVALLFVPLVLGVLQLAPIFRWVTAAAPERSAWLLPAAPIAAASIAAFTVARYLRSWPVPLLFALGLRAGLAPLSLGDEVTERVLAAAVIGATLLALLRVHAAWARPGRVSFGFVEDLAALALVLAVGGSACFARASTEPLAPAPIDGGMRAVLLRGLNQLSDIDRDGYGVLLGTRDCDPFDPMVHPAQHEWADNQRDDNCLGGDAVGAADALRRRVATAEPPPAFAGDIVMVTMEASARDATDEASFPALHALREEGVYFERAYATARDPAQALAGVLTSRLPTAIPETHVASRDPYPVDPPATLFESLRARGYDIGVVGALPLPALFTAGAGLIDPAHGESAEAMVVHALSTFGRLSPTRPRMLYVHLPRGERSDAMDRAIARLHRAVGANVAFLVVGRPRDDAQDELAPFEAVHVPLLVIAPSLIPRRVPAVTSTLTIAPTLLAMVAPTTAPVGRGPYLCLTLHACRDGEAPVAIEEPARHLHALLGRATYIVRDVRDGTTTAFDLAAPHAARRASDAEENALAFWEERGMTDEPGRFWPY